ncbi:MAG TPA: DedA family protein [Nitrososphaeraceae archaeon]|nr:DedA family protein [Nitrososphaeraceae archaeon]
MSITFEILKPVIDFVISFISTLGYPGIFLLSVLESALIPIPSEIIMPFSGFLVSNGTFDPISVVLAGTFGNLVGSILTYFLGIKVGRAFILKYGKYILFKKSHLEFTEELFQKYGDKISFFCRLLPAIRTYISLPCGVGKTNFVKFSIYTFLGSLIWNAMLTYVGIIFGHNWKNIDKYAIYLDIVSAVVISVFVIWFLVKIRKRSKTNHKREIPSSD